MSTYYNRSKDRATTLARKQARSHKQNLAEMGGNF